MAGKLGCVVVAVDGSEESMNALKWALDNLKLRSHGHDSEPGTFIILHVQSPPSIAAGLNPGAIPFGGPSKLEVPAFAAAIEAHQRRISKAIMDHALQLWAEKKVNVKTQVVVGDPKEMICDVTENLHADLLVMGCRPFGPIKRRPPSGVRGVRLLAFETLAKNANKSLLDLNHAKSVETINMTLWELSDRCDCLGNAAEFYKAQATKTEVKASAALKEAEEA
ncbi:hypothetical protein HHK36_009576 [Tetracentron sinense]|uniref:UspA domain-containing protein n=1 Tax=Tetracentron sinense TaxID=13715 RepID=A0A835DHL5_TETSI|nr:hypothetical protein HHK36_009576 [Tetracentron sinense]